MLDQSKVYQRFFCFGASKRIENTFCRDASLKTPFRWHLLSLARGATARRWTGDGEQGGFNPNMEQRRQEKIFPQRPG